MKAYKDRIVSESGQSIVIIAIVLVGMLAVAGLAIDGGSIYLQRRRAQNAADAGSIAGTRVLAQYVASCEDPGSGGDAQVAAAVNEFVASNGFSEANDDTIAAWYVDKDTQRLAEVGAGSIPLCCATGVEVELEATQPTYFLGVVGINESTVGSDAMAMTGLVKQFRGGILPIGVPLEVVLALGPDQDFVVLENNAHKGGSFCEDANGNGQYDEGFEVCVGDPASHNAHRGWLNLNYIYNVSAIETGNPLDRTFEREVPNRGCGSDPNISTDDGVKGWCEGGCPYPFPIYAGDVDKINGDFIHGSPGARQSSLREVIQTYNGQVVYIPIFDHIYMSDYMDDYDDYFPDPDIGWPRAGGGGHAFLYHIVGFTAVEIHDDRLNDHELSAEFKSAMVGGGQVDPNSLGASLCEPLFLHGVNLWE